MKLINFIIAISILQISLYAQSIWIGSEASIYVPEGADICAGEYGNIFGNIYGEGTQCGQLPIPVELNSFTAIKENSSVKLHWQTATESNNRGFEIQRKVFDEDWIELGFVEGSGNSTTPKEYTFTDKYPVGGSKFQYRLKELDIDGQIKYSEVIEVKIILDNFELFQNFPNPFNPATTIIYQLPQPGFVTLMIYDMLGNEITTLVNEQKTQGRYSVELDASELASGFYIYQLSVNNFVSSKKMLLVK